MSMRSAALDYQRLGLSVHPLPAGSKKSALAWAHRQVRAMTAEEITTYWIAHPNDNIAIITGALSGVVVVDVDPEHGGDPEPFKNLGAFVARTRSGGWHFYFKHPGQPVRSRAGVRPGVDVRGDGGYVVAPPSIVPPGHYAWDQASVCFDVLPVYPREVIEGAEAADVPDGAFAAFDTGHDQWLVSTLTKGAPMGEQRQALVRLAGYFAAKAIPADVAYGICFSWACRQVQRPGEPWMPQEVQALVESIYDKDARRVAEDPPVGAGPMTVGARVAAGGSAPTIVPIDSPSGTLLHDFVLRYEGFRTQWTVEDWLPEATIAFAISPPGGFKTWLLSELALSVAMGEPFLRRYPVHVPGPVLFIQQEDPESLLAARLAALGVSKCYTDADPEGFFRKPDASTPLYLWTDGQFKFSHQPSRDLLVERLRTIRPVLVILDPLYTACAPGQFFVEMPNHITWLKKLRRDYGCTFLLAHHTKKHNAEAGDLGREQMWGSNLMNAALETGWQIRPAGARSVTIVRHFKVSENKERCKFDFDIDLARVPALIATETALDDTVATTEEKDQLDEVHQLILSTIRAEKTALGLREIVRLVGKPSETVRRRLQQLEQRGLVIRGEGKRFAITTVHHSEVA